MKKLMLFFSALMIAALFTACEQDSLIPTDVTEEVVAELSLESEPELAALINMEEESGEIDERCSFNGSMAASKMQGYPGYSGKYKVTANNNPFPPANQTVDYRVRVWQRLNSNVWQKQGPTVIAYSTPTLTWYSPMYTISNTKTRHVYFLVEARSNGCSWKFIGNKFVQL